MNAEKVMAYFDARHSINPASGCWEWTGQLLKSGYGACNVGGIKSTAHRIQFWLFHGRIEPGREVHHKCHNPRCINLDHLEALSRADHARVSQKAQQTHCVHGHEFSQKNTYFKVSNGTRVCRACAAERQRESRKRK